MQWPSYITIDISHNNNKNNCKDFEVINFDNYFPDSNDILFTHANIRYFSINADEYVAYVNRLDVKVEMLCFSETLFEQESDAKITGYN